MSLGYFGSAMFYFAMACSLFYEAYVIMHVAEYAGAKWNRQKVTPAPIHALDWIYSIFVVVLLFTIYWKHAVLLLLIAVFHAVIEQLRKMQYHIFIADAVLCFITLLAILFYQMGA